MGKNRHLLQAAAETKKQMNKKNDPLAILADDIKLDKINLKEIKDRLSEYFAKYRDK